MKTTDNTDESPESGNQPLFEEQEVKESEPPPEEAIHHDLAELSRLLEAYPAIRDRILDVFDQHLGQGPMRESYERLMLGLGVLIGPSATRIVLESVKIQSNEFFEGLARSAAGEAEQESVMFLRHIAALYGHLVKDAFFLSFKHTDEDWRTADISCYRKAGGDSWFIELELVKYSGERVFLRMSPVSAFQLAELFIQELDKLPADASDNGIARRFRDLARSFKKGSSDPGVNDSPPDGYA